MSVLIGMIRDCQDEDVCNLAATTVSLLTEVGMEMMCEVGGRNGRFAGRGGLHGLRVFR